MAYVSGHLNLPGFFVCKTVFALPTVTAASLQSSCLSAVMPEGEKQQSRVHEAAACGFLPGCFTVYAGCFPKGVGVHLQAERKTYLISAVFYAFHFQGLPPTPQLNPQQVNHWKGDRFSVSIEMGSFLILMDLLLASG